jgi:phosphatidate phosphatase PAH1
VEKENPAGADAGAIDASKGTIKCHNIETVIPLMSGKGIENNFNKSVELIRKKGFAGIYYDRIAYQQKYNTKDYFESVEKKLAKIPNSKLIKSPDSIYQFVKFE